MSASIPQMDRGCYLSAVESESASSTESQLTFTQFNLHLQNHWEGENQVRGEWKLKKVPGRCYLAFPTSVPNWNSVSDVLGQGLISYSRLVKYPFLTSSKDPCRSEQAHIHCLRWWLGYFSLFKCVQSSRINFMPCKLFRLRLFLAQFPRPLLTLQYAAWHNAL